MALWPVPSTSSQASEPSVPIFLKITGLYAAFITRPPCVVVQAKRLPSRRSLMSSTMSLMLHASCERSSYSAC